VTCCFTGIFGLASAVSPNYYFLLLSRGLVGFGLGGGHVSFTLFAEFLPGISADNCAKQKENTAPRSSY